MKKKEIDNLRKKDDEELSKILQEKKKEYLVTYNQVGAGHEKNLRKPTNIRKDIAQILTIMKEKSLISEIKAKEEKEVKK